MRAFEIFLIVMAAWLGSGTLLSITTWSHWYVRGWDFPRVIVMVLAIATVLLHTLLFWDGSATDVAVLGGMLFVAIWQAYKIAPFLPPFPNAVMNASNPEPGSTFRLVVSNVLMENEDYARWLSVVRGAKPDVVVALETNAAWIRAIADLKQDLPHAMERPLENYYGMAVYSRLPLVDPEVRFLVQDDIPSFHSKVRLESGREIWMHALHPRPPEPLRNQDSAARDAELVLMAREIGDANGEPRVVAGDLNDVAWSYTTKLFLKLSGMLDPRRGRGMYSTFDARRPAFLRWPLDHVFQTPHFTIVALRLLPYVGSDHFPVLLELAYEPAAIKDQPVEEAAPSDEQNAAAILEREPPVDTPPVS